MISAVRHPFGILESPVVRVSLPHLGCLALALPLLRRPVEVLIDLPLPEEEVAPDVLERSDLQGRVDDWVDVVLLAREWVSPALQGQELLRRELELLLSGDLTACVLLPNPPKHPELSLVPLHRPEDQGQLALLRVQVLPGATSSSSSASWCHGFCDALSILM